VDTSAEVKDAECISECLLEVIDQVGKDDVVLVITCTDGASNCSLAGSFIEADHPHISWVHCTVHCLHLLPEDIGKLKWASDVIRSCKDVVAFITDHHRSLALFRTRRTRLWLSLLTCESALR
jgi:hypothetical protein